MADPLPIFSVPNATFVPGGKISDFGADLVYTSEGGYFGPCGKYRGPELSETIYPAPQTLPEDQLPSESLEGTFLFLGAFYDSHYGHLLTEGVARFWALRLLTDSRIRILGPDLPHVRSWAESTKPTDKRAWRRMFGNSPPRRDPAWQQLLAAAGVTPDRVILADHPVRVSELLVPECSMFNRHSTHQLHLETTRCLARKLVPDAARGDSGRSLPPVYLSRTRLTGEDKLVDGENAVEEYAESIGLHIVHPQNLSLTEQIELVNKYDMFIGVMGSAFHNLLFRYKQNPAHLLYLCLDIEEARSNYRQIDSVMGNVSSLCPCVRLTSETPRRLLLNPEAAIRSIKTFVETNAAHL